VLTRALRSTRIASPQAAIRPRPPAAGREPTFPPSSIRHVHVTASTYSGAFEQRRQTALLTAERVEKLQRVLDRQVAAEVGESRLYGLRLAGPRWPGGAGKRRAAGRPRGGRR